MALGSVGSMSVALLGDLKDFDRKMDGATGRVNTFSKSVQKMGTAVTKYAKMAALAATAAVVGFGVSAVKTFVEFDTGMREVFTLMPELSEMAREQMTEDVQELAKEIAIIPTKVIPALYQAISAGIPRENVFEFMEIAGKAAIGGVTELEVAVDGLTTVVNAYGIEMISAQEAADIMFTAVKFGKTTFEELSARMFQAVPVASKIGLEFKNVAAAASQITLAGVPMRIAMTQIRSLLNEVAFEGKELNKVFVEAAGMSFPAYLEAGGDIAGIIEILEGAAEKAGVTVAELTSNLEAQGAMLNLSGIALDSLRNILDEMTDSAGAADAAYEEMAAGVQYQLNQLKVWWQNLKLDIGADLTENLKDLLSWLEENREAIGDKIKAIFDGIISGMEWLKDNAGLVKAALITMAVGFTALWTAANPVAAAIIAITGALAWFEAEGGVAGVYDRLQDLAQGFRDLVFEEEEALKVTPAVRDALIDALAQSTAAVGQYMGRIKTDFATSKGVIDALYEAQVRAVESLEEGVRFDTVVSQFAEGVESILAEYGILDEEITTIYESILQQTLDMWSEATGVVVGSTQEIASSTNIMGKAQMAAIAEVNRVLAEYRASQEQTADTATEVATDVGNAAAEFARSQIAAVEEVMQLLEDYREKQEEQRRINEEIAASYAQMWESIRSNAATALVDMVKDFASYGSTRETEEETHQENLQRIRDEYADGSQEALETALGMAESEYKQHRTTVAGVLRDMFGDFATFLSDELLALAAAEAVKAAASLLALDLIGAGAHGLAAGRYAVGAAAVGILASSIPGYEEGGIVPGPMGAPQLAVVHGGEPIGAAGFAEVLDYERLGDAVAAGMGDVMEAFMGDGRPIIVQLPDGTTLAQGLYPSLQVESERRGGDGW